MIKEKVIDYVMNTPQNTNRAVLESLLNDSSGSDESEGETNYFNGEFRPYYDFDYGEYDYSGIAGIFLDVVIPETIKFMGEQAFGGNKALRSITLPEGMKAVTDEVFTGCEALTTIVLPSTITTINNAAFDGCSALKHIHLPANITRIADTAFRGVRDVVIDCEFADGAVSGAPWGATNATINYNVSHE